MDPVLKVKWIEALRSGKYQQGKEYLVDARGRMCCLGVLRHIQDPEAKYRYSNDSYDMEKTSYLHSEHAAGLSMPQMAELARMNDSGHTFEEIATFIEQSGN